MHGYSYAFIKRIHTLAKNKTAPVGVQLGAIAVQHEIPISKIAERVGVSRMTVYDWFTGKYEPKQSNLAKLKAYIERASA